jgi:hypothetical protein
LKLSLSALVLYRTAGQGRHSGGDRFFFVYVRQRYETKPVRNHLGATYKRILLYSRFRPVENISLPASSGIWMESSSDFRKLEQLHQNGNGGES